MLKQQRPLVKKYWGLASDQIDLFKNGGSTLGASWPYQYSQLVAAKAPVGTVDPEGGCHRLARHLDALVEGEAPELRLQVDAVHHAAPKAQAQQATSYGETPVNKKACAIMNTLAKGSCAQFSANAPESYYRSIKFWKTPIADCGNGKKNCTDLKAWTTAWTQIKG